jgi:hypothetical protein
MLKKVNEFLNHWCPVKLFRFLPTVEMTRYLEYFGRVGFCGGGGGGGPPPHKTPP